MTDDTWLDDVLNVLNVAYHHNEGLTPMHIAKAKRKIQKKLSAARLHEIEDMPTYYGFTERQTKMLDKRIAELKKEL